MAVNDQVGYKTFDTTILDIYLYILYIFFLYPSPPPSPPFWKQHKILVDFAFSLISIHEHCVNLCLKRAVLAPFPRLCKLDEQDSLVGIRWMRMVL